tara:strand:+ start:1140 stop:1895 length:756 start_codon:yes stop_codon:yes gene_type:complete
MSKLLVENKEVVVPGEVLAEGMEFLPSNGTYRLGDSILSNRLGLLHVDGKVLKSIPLSGTYLPKVNDVVVGKVIDILMSGWKISFNSPYHAVLGLKEASYDFIDNKADITKYFALDDHLIGKIIKVTSQNLVDITMKGPGLRKLRGGRIIKVNAQKVPRIIGKRGSMVSMIKNATNCKITVGQNGLVWVSGEPEQESLVINTINLIQERSHVSGLTDEIKKFLEKETGTKISLDLDENKSFEKKRFENKKE